MGGETQRLAPIAMICLLLHFVALGPMPFEACMTFACHQHHHRKGHPDGEWAREGLPIPHNLGESAASSPSIVSISMTFKITEQVTLGHLTKPRASSEPSPGDLRGRDRCAKHSFKELAL